MIRALNFLGPFTFHSAAKLATEDVCRLGGHFIRYSVQLMGDIKSQSANHMAAAQSA